jgi:hypothetical protein
MCNRGTEPVRAVWQTKPAVRTEAWFRSIDSLYREGRVHGDAMPGPLGLLGRARGFRTRV